MAASANSDTELLTEHFGYPPISLIDDIINSVNILAERALNSVEQGLLNASPATLGFKSSSNPSSRSHHHHPQEDDAEQRQTPADLAKTEIESGTHQLETLLCASIDRNFDKFEIYVLRNILCVRPADVRDWIRLSHYEGLDFTASSASASTSPSGGDHRDSRGEIGRNGDGGGRPTLESINYLRRKLRESMRLNALLNAERTRNERMLDELRDLVGSSSPSSRKIKSEESSVSPEKQRQQQKTSNHSNEGDGDGARIKGPFAFLHDKGVLTAGGADTPFSTTTAFTLSQMQALRALSTSLRNLTPHLRSPSPADPSSTRGGGQDEEEESKRNKSWRRERAEYVEGATRRHLETVQGLDLGRDGEVRDGDWQGAGRDIARGDVEGLERVVAILGGGSGDGDGDSDEGRNAAPESDEMDEF